MRAAALAAAAAVSLSISVASAGATSERSDGAPWTVLDGDQATAGAEDPGAPGSPRDEPLPPDTHVQTLPWQIEDCQIVTIPVAEPNLRAWCAAPAAFACPEGTVGVNPLKYRTRPKGGTGADWSGWALLNGPCAPAGDPTDDLDEAMARELKKLKIPAKQARIAPVTTWFAVQVPMTYYTDAGVERMRVTVLGTEVELELTPTLFSWDPGDGCEPVMSGEPGAAYPDRTVTHTYTKVGEYRVTLTTTWSGRFRVVGADGWRPIEGTGSTTHSSGTFTTREVRSVLS